MPEIRCPICDKMFNSEESDAMPFCSQRCRDVDLNRWFSEGYGFPYESEDEQSEENEER